MGHKERVIIPKRYSGKNYEEELIYEIVRSKRLPQGQISVIVQNDLSISVIASRSLNVDEINEIICLQYSSIEEEIERVKRKHL